nr:hypothetical protein OG296_39720 [Streptomyces sp. NBC_01001]
MEKGKAFLAYRGGYLITTDPAKIAEPSGPRKTSSADNGTLKRRVRELAAENKSLIGKLAASRDNIRFADKRIAEL